MALTLLLHSGGLDPAASLQCDAPRVIIGRARGCDLQLPDPSISPRHASLRQRGSHYLLVDEGSENGSFFQDTRLPSYSPQRVEIGDYFRLGRVWVQLQPAHSGACDQHAARELARRLVAHSLREQGQPSSLRVAIVRGNHADRHLDLNESRRAYTIGRARSADLTLKCDQIATRAVQVERLGDQVRLTLLSAQQGTTLAGNGLSEGRAQCWQAGTELALGSVGLAFKDPVITCLSEIESNETELLDPNEKIKAPRGSKAKPAQQPLPEDRPKPAPSKVALRKQQSPRLRWARNAGSERWTAEDSVVLSLALCVLGASLWAIHWVVHFDPI